MTKCSQEGCSVKTKSRGLCSMHYQRFKYRGTLDDIAPAKSPFCTVCSEPFAPRHDPRRIYCSQKCADVARRDARRADPRRAHATCGHCGVSLAGIRRDARYCSAKCGSDAKNARTTAATRANRKPCVHCGKPIPLHRQRFCSDACNLDHRRPEKYGLSRDELAALLAQHNVCAVCRSAEWGRKGPQIDHDHATGAIRGVLCSNCNQGLGRFRDDPVRLRAAVAYLER